MRRSHLGAATVVISSLFGGVVEAGNGSNYIHMLNGIDYFFGLAPYTGVPGLQGIWRCFPSDILHSPTRVTDPGSPSAGAYASKICAVHQSISASPFIFVMLPNVTLSTSDGKCHFLQSGGTAVNFGLASTGTSTGYAVVGPLSGQGSAAMISNTWSIANFGFTNPFSSPGFIIQTVLNLSGQFGSPSALPVPDGESLTLWHADMNTQAPGNNSYWNGSFDERNLCSGFSYLLSGAAIGGSNWVVGFNAAWEWSTGIGTVDATMTNVVSVGASGSGPSGLNAHASPATYAQPFDQGTGAMTVSVTGTTQFPYTTSMGEFLGFNSYDEFNQFGGSARFVCMNLWKLTADGSTNCNGAAPNPSVITLPTGGPGGPVLSALGNAPRVVAKLDFLAMTLHASPTWIVATTHTTAPGGSSIPWFPAAAGISASTGNSGSSFPIPLPALPSLVGSTLYASSFVTAVKSNNGHSHSNGIAMTFFP